MIAVVLDAIANTLTHLAAPILNAIDNAWDDLGTEDEGDQA